MSPIKPVFAYVLPLPSYLIRRIYDEGKRGLVKYLPRERTGLRIAKDTKIIFYKSGEDMNLVGEASVIAVKLLYAKEAISFLKEDLILSQEELWDYVKKYPNRENKRLLALLVDEPIVYEPELQWQDHMSMIGCFLSSEEYKGLIRKRRQ